jgi:hypothetical protein
MNQKQTPGKKSPSSPWDEMRTHVRKHSEKTGIPFHLWMLQAEQNQSPPILVIADPILELHRAFREELLS